MKSFSLSSVADHLVQKGLAEAVANESLSTADVLAWIAEFDARKLYLPAAYPRMYEYCLRELHMSEDRAGKRIRAARAAREFPANFEMVADQRLSLSAVVTLVAKLNRENAAELLAAAAHKTRAEVEVLLAERFPRSDTPTSLRAVPDPRTGGTGALVQPEAPAESSVASEPSVASAGLLTPGGPDESADSPAPGRVDSSQGAQALLAHAVPSGDIAEVLDRALDALIERVEKRRYATASKPGAKRRSTNPRQIPAEVRRAVRQRDGARCTFVSASGKRCEEARFLEYDHIQPVARGGQATVKNIRLRCRAHNQLEAERTYGAGFMRERRQAAKARAETASMLQGVVAERARMRAGAQGAVMQGLAGMSAASGVDSANPT